MPSAATRARLRAAADAASLLAYAPYSRFRVGAAVLADGEVFIGCNVENASSNLGLCAERVAVASAIAAGRRSITAVAVSFADLAADAPAAQQMPCGACRQVLAEFAGDDLVVMTPAGDFTLANLLPHPFRLELK